MSPFAEHGGHRAREIFSDIQLDFALASRTVFYAMAGVMAIAFRSLVAGMPRGKVEQEVVA